MGDQIFGCDTCQDVCPKNKDLPLTQFKEFFPEQGVGVFLDPLEILAIENEKDFQDKFNGTPLLRTKLSGLKRNAEIVLRQ